jgi:hypothetical protein
MAAAFSRKKRALRLGQTHIQGVGPSLIYMAQWFLVPNIVQRSIKRVPPGHSRSLAIRTHRDLVPSLQTVGMLQLLLPNRRPRKKIEVISSKKPHAQRCSCSYLLKLGLGVKPLSEVQHEQRSARHLQQSHVTVVVQMFYVIRK